MGDAGLDSAKAAGWLLSSLLMRHPYRDRWEPHERRGSDDAPSQAAVAQVIALHLWDSGQRPDSELALARRLKDRVARALNGDVLSAETLTWFIEAFGMSAEDADRLRDARFPRRSGAQLPIIGTLRHPQYVPIPQRHRTVAVFERRVIGPDRRPAAHRTTRAIVAGEDGVDSFPCRLFRGATDVVIRHGGHVVGRREFEGSTPVLEIRLNTPLRMGQVASLDYEVSFGPGNGNTREYRRVVHRRAENIDIVVQFDLLRPPQRLWWSIWDDYREGTVLLEEPVKLDEDQCVHRFVPSMENAAAGFRWAW